MARTCGSRPNTVSRRSRSVTGCSSPTPTRRRASTTAMSAPSPALTWASDSSPPSSTAGATCRGQPGTSRASGTATPGRSTRGRERSCASPPVRRKLTGLPSASVRAWILVLNPPRDRPIAWSSPAFFGTGAVLMSTYNGAVDHRIFVVGLSSEMLENLLPDARFGPSTEALMHILPIAAAFRQIAPRHTGSITIQHCFDEQPIVRSCHPHMTLLPSQ